MIILPAVLIIAFGIYRGLTVKKARPYLWLLLSVLVLGFNNLVIDMSLTGKTDCGSYFEPDIGCSNILPGWFVLFSLGLLLLAIVISLYMIIKFRRKTQAD